MEVYSFHPETKEYTGPTQAQHNPEGEGYLVPAFATQLQPPSFGNNEIPVLKRESGDPVADIGDTNIVDDLYWDLVDDYRGVYWNKETKEKVGINQLGETLDLSKYTTKQPPEVNEKLNKGVVFNEVENNWEVVDDYLGEVFWDKATGEKIEITEKGVAPKSDWTKKEPPTITESNKIAVFNDDKDIWEIKADYRGVYYDAFGNEHEITKLEIYPESNWTKNKPSLEEIKKSYLADVREKTKKLINNRYKNHDRENLFVLEVKADIRDRETGQRVEKAAVKDNIQAILKACNELEGQIEAAQDEEELSQIDLSEENLRAKATDRPEDELTGSWIVD